MHHLELPNGALPAGCRWVLCIVQGLHLQTLFGRWLPVSQEATTARGGGPGGGGRCELYRPSRHRSILKTTATSGTYTASTPVRRFPGRSDCMFGPKLQVTVP